MIISHGMTLIVKNIEKRFTKTGRIYNSKKTQEAKTAIN